MLQQQIFDAIDDDNSGTITVQGHSAEQQSPFFAKSCKDLAFRTYGCGGQWTGEQLTDTATRYRLTFSSLNSVCFQFATNVYNAFRALDKNNTGPRGLKLHITFL